MAFPDTPLIAKVIKRHLCTSFLPFSLAVFFLKDKWLMNDYRPPIDLNETGV